MDSDIVIKVAKTLVEKVLTPIVYMLEEEHSIELICFCDSNIKMKEIYDAQNAVEMVCGKKAEIVDIRALSESERIRVVQEAEIIYSEDPIIEQLFVMSMYEDFQMAMGQKREMLQRYRESGSCYLQ